MKTKRTLWLIALFAAGQVMAQQQIDEQRTANSADAAHINIGKVDAHWLAPIQPADERNNLEPVKGLSPQAWTTIVGWHPGQSAFPDMNDANFTTEMPLIWIGNEPQQ